MIDEARFGLIVATSRGTRHATPERARQAQNEVTKARQAAISLLLLRSRMGRKLGPLAAAAMREAVA